jgi:uncharacterized protein (TIGR02145 family)
MKKLVTTPAIFIFFFLITGCKKDPNLATLSTEPISELTFTSAKTGGNITNDGGAGIISKGVCWGTDAEPTIEGNSTNEGQGSENFVSNITGLIEGTTYYVRAYATNKAGTSYGEEITFTTPVTQVATLTTKEIINISVVSALSGGIISNDGGAQITGRGICWSTSENPTIENSHTTDGAGTGDFNSSISQLTEGTVYYVRAYATNNKGTAYGNQVTFSTAAAQTATIITKDVTAISYNTATSGGDIPNDGGSPVTAKGVCWSTSENPTISNSHTTDGSGSESYSSNMTDLVEGTTYYVRAYAMNNKGTAYGNQISFTTTTAKLPVLTTRTIAEISFTSARSGGDITEDGGAPITAKGICWNTHEDPTINNSLTNDGAGNEGFNSLMPGLAAGTTYYVRAYATNRIGTAYGNQQTFTTSAAILPGVTTAAVSEISYNTAKSGGEVLTDGGSPVTSKGICWSTSDNPVVSDNHTTNGTGTGAFISNMTGLTNGTTYHVRAYATNSVGTAYGDEVTFSTVSIGMAQLSTTALSGITETTAVSGGNITNNAGSAVSARGVCWSTSPNPTTADFNTHNGSGSGAFTSNLTGLTGGTVYHVRAYATNGAGTSYGEDLTFITPITDVEGHVYKTVLIGSQVWMAENLRATRFNDNTPIMEVVDTTTWKAQITTHTPAYCWYNNNISNGATYGALYNWFVAGTGNVCPQNWHVGSEQDFQTLELYLGLPADSINAWGWRGTGVSPHLKSSSWDGDNTSGFDALPAGYRAWVNAKFSGLGELTYFWTSSDDAINHKPQLGWYRRLDRSISWIYKAPTEKAGGKSIRCIKN